MFAMEDAIKSSNYKIYLELFDGLKNPNGCPVKTTYFVSDKYTNYELVKDLHNKGLFIGIAICFYLIIQNDGNMV